MRNYWFVIILFCVGTAQAQFVRNSGLTVINSANVAVNSDWDNQNSSFTNNGTITLSDNWTSTGGYSQAGTGGFVLTNTVTKQFNHSRQYVGFLTKDGAGITQVNDHLIVKANLTLLNGLLSMTGANDTLVMQANAQASATPSSYVVGKVTRYGTGDLFFPVSRASNYLPITISQVMGTNPRVTVSVEDKPGGYAAGANVSQLTSFPYVWRSAVLRGDTATYVEVQYPTTLASPAATIVTRTAAGSTYASMGMQSLITASGVTKIKSYSAGLKGLFSVAIGPLLTLDAPVPSAASAISHNGFTANWVAVTSATGYQLDVSSDNFATFVPGYNNLAVAASGIVITGLTTLTSYTYRVRATGTAPTSPTSNVISATTLAIPPPVATAATSITSTAFTANWIAVTGATGYRLDVSADNFATFVIGFSNKSIVGTSDLVTGLTLGTTYKYRVRAVDPNSQSVDSNTIDAATLATQNQTISFAAISAKTFGDAPFNLGATATSGLAIQYSATPAGRVTLSGNQVTLVAAGSVTIQADQPGNTNFLAATQVTQTFCINPAKPTITLSGANTEAPILTSSSTSGNQWFLNGAAISGATNTTFTVSGAGVYTVQSSADNCTSAVSDQQAIIITGDLVADWGKEFTLFPNPVHDKLTVQLNEFSTQPVQIIIYDLSGKVLEQVIGKGKSNVVFDVQSYAHGIYILRASQSGKVNQKQFVKE